MNIQNGFLVVMNKIELIEALQDEEPESMVQGPFKRLAIQGLYSMEYYS